ncbi:hypothetical protein PIB30_048057 [Stylosanthes scabra]|uniref:Uncharacterized protein n=1 Tax=Stylosanthes scabra TaxID=79078 RepID=A0ABU6SH12_9FABA|nr:hypothetical protein [Stylosanthes scabra]
MEPTQQQLGIKVYNATPPPSHDDTCNSSGPVTLPVIPPDAVRKNRRAIMAKGVQKTLNKTSLLGNFLPTGTLLTFEMVLPSVYKNGQYGTIYYGFVTPRGLSVFKPGIPVQVPKEEKYKVSFTDFVHAFMSVLVFVAIAFSDHRVTNCLFPGHEKDMDQVMESFPLMVGVVCSGLFLVFPNSRRGIGCMSA